MEAVSWLDVQEGEWLEMTVDFSKLSMHVDVKRTPPPPPAPG